MRECASAMLAAGANARAVSVLEELRKRHPKDLRILAQLITAYTTVDPVSAQKVGRACLNSFAMFKLMTGSNFCKKLMISVESLVIQVSQDLPSPEEMAQGVNVDELEAHCFASGPKYSRKTQAKEAGKDPASPGKGLEKGLFFSCCTLRCYCKDHLE